MPYLDNWYEAAHNIIESNEVAMGKESKYPLQEQATLIEMWEYVPCDKTKCKFRMEKECKYWKLKSNITFNQFVEGIVRMFTPKRARPRLVRQNLGAETYFPIFQNISDTDGSRVGKLARELRALEPVYREVHAESIRTIGCILSDDFNIPEHNIFNFTTNETIYKAKIASAFLPDICVPYDTGSRIKLLGYLRIGNENIRYADLCQKLAAKARDLLTSTNRNVVDFRSLDAVPPVTNENQSEIAFICANINYIQEILERPLSRVIDKVFYGLEDDDNN